MGGSEDRSVLGIDVGGTKIAAARVVGGRIEDALERPTDISGPEAVLDGIEAAAAEILERGGAVDAVGVGMPSQIEFASGTAVASVNIPLAGVPLREELGSRLGGLPIYVDNDANCAALAEAELAEGGPVSNLVMLTLGTGVGGGIVIGGQIFRGATGLGAELGHMVIDPDGPPCPGAGCPSRGCLEAFCSGTALGRDATEVALARPDSALGRAAVDGVVQGPDVVAAAKQGDSEAMRLTERLGTHLGIGISNLVNAFEPERVVVGGGLSRAADLFIGTAHAEAAERALPALFERVEIAVASGTSDAGTIGAGLLAAREHARAGREPLTTSSKGAT